MGRMSVAALSLFAVVCLLAVHGVIGEPIVTLSHGGKLRGRSESFMGTPVDLFLGVRYAKPPVGELRFKKPEEFPAWEGTVDATSIATPCLQLDFLGEDPTATKGSEDCLTLDITVPGGVKVGAKKPVMVWIHGGGYAAGTGISYIAAALAVTGDVVVVSINYRLGLLGFLSLSRGTGNYGLWDQRAALLWVKKNIEQFGGDPGLVTIFGESAGGGSVSCQTIGQHNDGLFKRGIAQSGTAFMLNSFSSPSARPKVEAAIRPQAGCADDEEIYDCLRKMSGEDLVKKIQTPIYMTPAADGDFFDDETLDKMSYGKSHRFDLMAGVNGQEGGLMYSFELGAFAAQQNMSTDEGVSMQLAQDFLLFKCKTQITPLSPSLCADFIIRTYKIDEAQDDKERATRLMEFLGEVLFDIGTVNQLEQHSLSSKSTYGYYFTDLVGVQNPMWLIPDWLKTKADHGDELFYVFGGSYVSDEIKKDGIWKDLLLSDKMMGAFWGVNAEEVPLSLDMMKMWTNFAKTGDPNKPMALSKDIPVWPEFTTTANQVLELNRKRTEVIPMANKERLDSLQRNLFEAHYLQQAVNVGVAQPDQTAQQQQQKHDEL